MNEDKTTRCPRCGAAMQVGAVEGLCPRCLMAMNLETRTMPDGESARMLPPWSPEELREHFPQFEIIECLGRGGMGVVYKARQKTLDRLVAIKVLAGEWQGRPGFAERFEKEAKTLAQMSHPNIVTVHDFGETGGQFYIVMEFVDGVNLRDLLNDGKMEADQALAIVPPVCEALEYAHGKGVVHRDIKPENLLLDRDGRVKIADFGIASLAGASDERSGTVPYMAPEQNSGSVDRRADIYALGVVLYEMLTGDCPTGEIVEVSRKVEVDVRIDEMVMRALEKEPELRYQTAGEFRTQVQTIASPQEPQASAAKPETPNAEPPPRRGWLAMVAIWFGFLSALLPTLFYWLRPWAAPWLTSQGRELMLHLTLVCAVIAIILGFLAKRTVLGRRAMIVGGISVTIWMAFFLAGWASAQKSMPSVTAVQNDRGLYLSFTRQPKGLSEAQLLDFTLKSPIESVDLMDTGVSDELLKAVTSRHELERLNLGSSLPNKSPQMTDERLKTLSGLKNLKKLILHGNPITDEGLEHLASLPNLEFLQLGSTKIKGPGLASLPHLKWLRLDATPITDDGLAAAARMRNLEQLYLDLTEISDEGLVHLRSLRKLRVLNLHSTRVTGEGIKKLKEALPDLKVGWDGSDSEPVSAADAQFIWPNGAAIEVVGTLRNPRQNPIWLRPDGSVFEEAPVEVMGLKKAMTADTPSRPVRPEDEVVIYYRVNLPEGLSGEQMRISIDPSPTELALGDSFPEVRGESKDSAVHGLRHFAIESDQETVSLRARLVFSDAAWEPVASYDLEKTQEHLGGAMVVFSPPHYDEGGERYRIDVMHNLPRNEHAMRLVAVMGNGRRHPVDFHSGVLRGTPTKGFALVYPREMDVKQVRKYVLERTPYMAGSIERIPVRKKSPAGF